MLTPVWIQGRVPNGYWYVRENRLRYVKWLGKKLGFRTQNDWYRVTRRSFHENHGGGMLWGAYRDSPYAAMCDCFPHKDWKAWFFSSTPQRYWRQASNRRLYMDWLGKQLKLRNKNDWHSVTKDDFYNHQGGGLLSNYFANSASAAIREYLNDRKLHAWEFTSVPQHFWQNRDNCNRYMDWLGKKLGFRKPEDWYKISRSDFHENRGGALFVHAGGSPLNVMRNYMPDYDWKPWLFSRVPRGFWNVPENRLAYLKWLGKELNFRRPTDWYRIQRSDFVRTGGNAMLNMCHNNCLFRAIQERYPNYRWSSKRFYKRNGYRQLSLFE